MSFIEAVHTVLPENSYNIEELTPFFKKWVESQGAGFAAKALRILKGAGIKRRHTIAPLEVLFSDRTFEESNNLYCKKAIELGTRVLKETLEKENIKPEEIDCLITTSCTGLMIPSFNAYVMNEAGLRNDIRHLPITEIGCAGGVSALIYADDYLKAYPNHKVAIITLEFPSNTIQTKDYSWDNVVGTALFADGVACAILSGDAIPNNKAKAEILDTKMIQLPNSTQILSYNLTNNGLRMGLDKHLPNIIEENFSKFTKDFLNKNNLSIDTVNNYLIHPGGIKILDKIENILSQSGGNVDLSRKVMERHGNMSSSTILFILKEYLDKKKAEEKTMLLSFGPGFSAHQALIESL